MRHFDETYVAALRNRDDAICRDFDATFRPKIRSILRQKLGWGSWDRADDLIQDVLCAAFVNMDKGEPRDCAKLPAYVASIARNTASQEIDRLKKDRKNVAADDIVLPADPHPSIERRLLSRAQKSQVVSCLKTMKKRSRDILVDEYFYGLDREEICQKYKVTREQLRMILFHALAPVPQ